MALLEIGDPFHGPLLFPRNQEYTEIESLQRYNRRCSILKLPLMVILLSGTLRTSIAVAPTYEVVVEVVSLIP